MWCVHRQGSGCFCLTSESAALQRQLCGVCSCTLRSKFVDTAMHDHLRYLCRNRVEDLGRAAAKHASNRGTGAEGRTSPSTRVWFNKWHCHPYGHIGSLTPGSEEQSVSCPSTVDHTNDSTESGRVTKGSSKTRHARPDRRGRHGTWACSVIYGSEPS